MVVTMKNSIIFDTIIGKLYLAETDGAISHLYFAGDPSEYETAGVETPLLREARSQINSYLEGKRTSFDLPLSPKGTPFQEKVWEALQTIPYGETISYKELATRAGNPKASRAVGMANNKNPISVIIPCHRVIGANGQLVGYGGGLPLKEQLLRLEGVLS
ncbi:methylated-DNA--[protein]-cysteine S-methyltransferase [Anaerocolumna sp. AGMB13020]|uniref:methylated-DNA--[protein]-cysteine S-methyltransferase n=1 Tax=Anaerocolumna sp. AGMB13020 TaxID=3081750 RepID=UPI00295528E6|nr:methylated-DNA--[protein]-cysteine S-methyltransferase [Anaerocolumna sp. AGMB13020]WOO39022.1 methylated-DNA--[protein]-cysteine S-methyltransferase [Anaerocolumna sp. AGMB13020]